MFAYLQSNPGQLSEIPLANISAVNHDSNTCLELLQLEPYDLAVTKGELNGGSPTFSVLWIGGPDAEQSVPPGVYSPCVVSYISAYLAYFPQTVIVFPNVPADVCTVPNLPSNYLQLVQAYNAALPSILSQFACGSVPEGCVVPVDDYTITSLQSGQCQGYGNPNFTYIDFNSLGWQVVMPEFRSAIYPIIGGQ
jgi:hypothetical protein